MASGRNGGGGIRTHGTLAGSPVFETGPPFSQVVQSKDVGNGSALSVPPLVPIVENETVDCQGMDADLAEVVRVWGSLASHVKLAILALVHSSQR